MMPAIPFSSIFAAVQGVTWLWPNWLPLGQVTALVAEPGTGKSAIALWLAGCSALTMPPGEALVWPDGQPIVPPSSGAPPFPVLWCEAEARWAGHRTRAEELRMPLAALYSPIAYDQTYRLDSATDVKALSEACTTLKPRLIVLDSLAASHAHSGSGENGAQMHKMIVPLQSLAAKHNACVLVLHHLKKDDRKNPRDRITLDDARGSSAIGAACTSVIAIDRPDANDKGNRRLYVVKTNFAPDFPPEVGFRWLSKELPNGARESCFVFGNAPVNARAVTGKNAAVKRAAIEAALTIALTPNWELASVVTAQVVAQLPGIQSAAVQSVAADMRARGQLLLRWQAAKGGTGAPSAMWKAP